MHWLEREAQMHRAIASLDLEQALVHLGEPEAQFLPLFIPNK